LPIKPHKPILARPDGTGTTTIDFCDRNRL
jgi:hypothetical protein